MGKRRGNSVERVKVGGEIREERSVDGKQVEVDERIAYLSVAIERRD